MSETFDIVIAGGGVIGASVAYYLSKDRDLSIALVDVHNPGMASFASAGGLWPIGESVGLGCGVIFFKTLSKQAAQQTDQDVVLQRPPQLPPFFFDFCLKSNALFPSLYQTLKQEHGVDFKLEKTGLKFVLYDEYDHIYARELADSIPHLAQHLRWLDKEELAAEEPYVTPEATGALMFLSDDQVNPYLLVESYKEAARQNGVKMFARTRVRDVIVRGERVTGVVTDNGVINCGTLINAAGAWASDITRMALGREIPVTPIRGQVVVSEKLPKILRSCLSTSDCYIAQKDNGEVLIGSTTEEQGYSASCTYTGLRGLVEGAVKCIPKLKEVNIKRTWAGLRPGTPDEIPILGPVQGREGYLNACGHFRTGILTSAITGEILHALVHDQPPPIDLNPFLLDRFEVR